MKKLEKNIVISNALFVLLITLIVLFSIVATSCQSKSGLTSRAMKDGRWEQFEQCIDPSPTDWRCDSCWQVHIKQKPMKGSNQKQRQTMP